MPGPLAPLRQRKLPIPLPTTPMPGASAEECRQLHEYLQRTGYVGSVNGIKRAALRPQFSAAVGRYVSDRRLQRIVADAPARGYPIASNSRTGYFVVDVRDDLDECIEELESRIAEHTIRADSLRAFRGALQPRK